MTKSRSITHLFFLSFMLRPGVAYTSECFPCKPGSFSRVPGSSACEACPRDSYSGHGASSCTPCSTSTQYAGMDRKIHSPLQVYFESWKQRYETALFHSLIAIISTHRNTSKGCAEILSYFMLQLSNFRKRNRLVSSAQRACVIAGGIAGFGSWGSENDAWSFMLVNFLTRIYLKTFPYSKQPMH